MDAKLRVVRGPLSGETIRVPVGKLLIGRETDCQLRLDSKSVSLHHCVLLLDEYTLRIRDLGSTNGTLVNGHRVGKHESILMHDDTISIDDLTFRIDLSSESDPLAFTPADEQPADSSSALDATAILDGDTHPVVPIEASPTEVAPVEAFQVSSPEPPSQNESALPKAASNAGARMTLQSSGAMVAERRVATTAPPSVSSRHVTPPKTSPKKVVEQAATPTTQSKPSAVEPKRTAKPQSKAAGKVERSAKTSTSIGLGRVLPIAGLIGLVALVAGGAYFLRGPGQATPYAAPPAYVVFSPKSFEAVLSCEVPADWKQRFRGGKNVGPVWAGFTDGRLSVEISENLTGGAIREAVVAMRKKAAPARRDAPAAEQIHEYLRDKSSENFKSYNEAPRSRGIKTKGYGEAQISDFTATEGVFSTEIRGCRATALNQAHQLTVICKCPASLFEDARPVFEKIVASLSFEAAADAK
jgi:hypothetical protein